MRLDELTPAKGATHRKKRVGCGRRSGHGKTSCRGQKGQKSRTGRGLPPHSEGGQMPLIRRIPKRGFYHESRETVEIVNLSSLNRLKTTEAIDPKVLSERGMIRSAGSIVKILGTGELKSKVVVRAHRFSKSAAAQIEKAGGQVERLELPKAAGR